MITNYPCGTCKERPADGRISEKCMKTCHYGATLYNLSMLAWEEEGCAVCRNYKTCDIENSKCYIKKPYGSVRNYKTTRFVLDIDALQRAVEFGVIK